MRLALKIAILVLFAFIVASYGSVIWVIMERSSRIECRQLAIRDNSPINTCGGPSDIERWLDRVTK
jgi:hypothetical protein